MSVTFSGLTSGIDTASIIEAIIEVEKAPITTMEDTQTYLETKLDAYSEFNTLLDTFAAAISGLNSADDLKSFAVTNNGSDFFSLTTTSLTTAGTYSVEIVSLAQQQKDVSTSSVADIDTTALTGTLTIGEKTLSYADQTLSDLIDTINGGDYGVTASIIDDGTDSGYRLMLTAETAGEFFAITGTGSLLLDTATNGHSVDGSKAHVVVDGIDYYSSANTMTNAIKGTTLTLLAESEDGANTVQIESDAEEVIATQLESMVETYNAINTYIDTLSDSDPTLANSMKSVQRSLRSSLTGSSLVQLGISSDWETGELSFDSDKLSEAYAADSAAVQTALIGDDDNSGVLSRLEAYLSDQLDSSSGFLVTKKNSVNKQIDDLEDRITAMETRLEKRQATLEAQYAAMETLVSSLNSQGDYLTSFFDSYSSS